MTFSIPCPECKATLKSSKAIPAGKIITCPKCSLMFPAPAVKPKPVPVPAGVDVVEEDDEFADVEIVEDPPKKPQAKPKSPIPDRPRRKRPKKSNVGLIIGLCVGLIVFAGLATGAVFGIKWLLAENNDPVAFMPPKAPIMLSVDVARLMDSPFGSSIEPLLKTGEFGKYCEDAGVSPKAAVDRLAVGVGMSRPGVPGAFSLVLESKSGFDRQKFAKAFNATPTTFGGRSVFQAGSGMAAQSMVFTSKIAAVISGPAAEAEDAVRTAGRNSPTSMMTDMMKRVSDHHIWAIIDTVNMPLNDNPMIKGAPTATRDAFANCRCMGYGINLNGDVMEVKTHMLMGSAAAAEAFVTESKKSEASFAAFGLNPVEPPTYEVKDTLATTTLKLKTADLVAGINTTIARFATMFAPTQQPQGGGRGGRGGR